MCYDDELWFNRTTPVVTEPFTVDVIIHAAHLNSFEGHVMERLAEHQWKCSHRPRKTPTTFVLSPLREFVGYRFPVTGGGMPISQLKQCAEEVEKVIVKLRNTFDGCGWFTGTPQIKIVNFHTDPNQANVLCEPGTEHMYPLLVSSKEVADWIFGGSVESGKVLLVKGSYRDLDHYLNPSIDSELLTFEELHSSNADVIVFYCKYPSPDAITPYHKWLRENHPDSKQRCLMLKGGVNGLYRYLKSAQYSDDDIAKVFRR